MPPVNFVRLLLDRELGGVLGSGGGRRDAARANRGLYEWATWDSLRHSASECCSLGNAHPRSTIAVAISRDGNISASTHGDHTVKIIDFNSGKFVRSLEGHHRTPWTVRFHPINSSIVVSGSLDYEVKVWDVDTGECLQSKDFGRPISSLCFHPSGEMLAVAAGHKLHLWEYDKEAGRFGESNVILKTSKTIRTVHFHPLGAPMIMTTERIEPKPIQEGSDAVGSRNPQVLGDLTLGAMAPISAPWFPTHDGPGHPTMQHQAAMVWNHPYAGPVIAPSNTASREILSLGNQMPQIGVVQPPPPPAPPPPPPPPPPMQDPNWWGHGTGMGPSHSHGANGYFGSWSGSESHSGHFPSGEIDLPPMPPHPGMSHNVSSGNGSWHSQSDLDRSPEETGMSSSVIMRLARNFGGRRGNNRQFHRGERRYSHDMDMHSVRMPRHAAHRHQQSADEMELRRVEGWQHHTLSLGPSQGVDPLPPMQLPPWPERSESQQRGRRRHQRSRHGSYGGHGSQDHIQMPIIPEISLVDRNPYGIPPPLANLPVANVPLLNLPYTSLELQRTGGPSEVPVITQNTLSRIGQIFASFSSFNSQDLPCTTKLTMWKFDEEKPHKYLDQPVMQIPGTVLCSEMGAHMSPCGRLLAICTALGSVPSHGPDSVHYSYELKVISLENETFGEVIRSRAISAGHCLTSVQFSPGSDMILLSYGRKHRSLVRELVSRGQTVAKIHTLLEVYRASDLSLERVLHSVEDEANTACFHPFPGEGIFYGTKGGKLRILRHTKSNAPDADDGDSSKFEDELLEVDEMEDSTALGIEGASC